MFKLQLIKPGHSDVKPIIINTANCVTLYTYNSGNKVFDKTNCKELESIDWSGVGSFKIDMNPCPTFFDPDQWIISDIL